MGTTSLEQRFLTRVVGKKFQKNSLLVESATLFGDPRTSTTKCTAKSTKSCTAASWLKRIYSIIAIQKEART
jgi:hypothetical protein